MSITSESNGLHQHTVLSELSIPRVGIGRRKLRLPEGAQENGESGYLPCAEGAQETPRPHSLLWLWQQIGDWQRKRNYPRSLEKPGCHRNTGHFSPLVQIRAETCSVVPLASLCLQKSKNHVKIMHLPESSIFTNEKPHIEGKKKEIRIIHFVCSPRK